MIPVLYESTATSFDSCGLGELAECTSCVVTEVRNGEFYLDLEYPITGIRYPDIAVGRLIKAANAPGESNIFCIESVDYSLDGIVKVYAPQITYLRMSNARRFTAGDALTWTKTEGMTQGDVYHIFDTLRKAIRPRMTEVLDEHGNILVQPVVLTGNFSFPVGTSFTFPWSSKTMTAVEVAQVVAEVLGGEIAWGFNRMSIRQARGTNTGLEVRYGVNLKALDAETDGESYVTAIVNGKDFDVDQLDSYYIQAESPGVFPFFRLEIAEGENASYLETSARLSTAIKVDFDAEGANVDFDGDIWNLKLCDTVKVVHPGLDLMQDAKIVKTVFDCLLERYDSVSVGEVVKDITDAIVAAIRGK